MATRTEQLLKDHPARSAREVVVGHIGADPYAAIERLNEIGHEKALATAVAYELEQKRKSLLATLASEYARMYADESLSEAKLERLARADIRYTDHIKATADAIENRERASSEYWAIRSELEWDRAAIAHLNALTKLDE
tara:strand:+ start:7513 stop:7929 length:417 start_codon:yes stop_codon:yes gene_type:complete